MNKCAIIVTYNPNLEVLKNLCKQLFIANVKAIIIDNSDTINKEALSKLGNEKCEVNFLNGNEGIAKAQNVGIKLALLQKMDLIYLFDQDSIISPNFLSLLSKPLDFKKANVSAPVAIDERSGSELPSFKVSSFGFIKKIFSYNSSEILSVDLVISSGMAITAKTFEKVGLLDERFFIDFVDFDWCFRCKEKGVPIYIAPNAIMEHSIGLGASNIFGGGTIHNYQRSYYKVRNCFILLRQGHVPICYSLRMLFLIYIQQLIAIISLKERKNYISSLYHSTIDGLLARFGKRN